MKLQDKWSASLDGENYCYVVFDTEKETLSMAKSEMGLKPGDKFSIGQCNVFVVKNSIDPRDILENLQEQSFDFAGEAAEGHFDRESKEDLKELGDALNKVLENWVVEHYGEPQFYGIKNSKEMIMTEDGGFEEYKND